VVIIGAGFGGLSAARKLAGAPVDVLIVDRNNYHGFWPLLYQVATASLDPEEIAQPVRAITRRTPSIKFRLATVHAVNREQRLVQTNHGDIPYDELIVSPGSATNFFGNEQVEREGFELKDVPDAVAIRNRLISCFELALTEPDPAERRRLLTFVLVGGGPTGVEMSGSIAELIRHVLRCDYPTLDSSEMRVILVEAVDRVLLAFPPSLSEKAQRGLADLGVELRFGASVTGYENGMLQFKDGTTLPTETVIWTAGVKGAPLGEELGVPLERGGRVPVTPELHLADDPNVWVIGDLAHLPDRQGKPYPQIATVAMQQGRHAARNIMRKLRGQPLRSFRYVDKGTMATVGRRSAVAHIWGLNWSGTLAWFLWLGVHIWYLIGFRNRVQVLLNWAYYYFTYDRGSRAIIDSHPRQSTHWHEDGTQADHALVENKQEVVGA
jgi:NADH dehydrogenase